MQIKSLASERVPAIKVFNSIQTLKFYKLFPLNKLKGTSCPQAQPEIIENILIPTDKHKYASVDLEFRLVLTPYHPRPKS